MPHRCPVPPLASRGRLAMTKGQLCDWGDRVGRLALPPQVFALAGELGTGKTTLVQAICHGYGVTDAVTSPTFSLIHEYTAPRSLVYHLDLYRLTGPADLFNLGWDELMERDALIFIEWPERAADQLPRGRVAIRLEHLPGESERRLLYAGGHV